MIVRAPPPLRAFLQTLARLISEGDAAVTTISDDNVQDDRAFAGWNGDRYVGVYVTDDGERWEFALTGDEVDRLASGSLTEISVRGTSRAAPAAEDEGEDTSNEPTTPPSAAVALVNSLVAEGLLELAANADVERLGLGLAACLDGKQGRRRILAFLQGSSDVEEHYLSDDDLEGLIERW
jgi:hypothetical protein